MEDQESWVGIWLGIKFDNDIIHIIILLRSSNGRKNCWNIIFLVI